MRCGTLLIACCLLLIEAATAAERPATQPVFGVVQCDPFRSETNFAAGARLVVLSVAWDVYEPMPGQYDDGYIARVRRAMQTYRRSGLGLVLDLGLQYPPAWTQLLPHASYVNQYGHSYSVAGRPGANGLNAVFSEAVRERQASYVRHVLGQLGSDFHAIRLGWGYYGELNFPETVFRGRENCYWAFDDLAQGRAQGLPKGMSVCPVPGWVPGMPSGDNADARRFLEWYLESLRNYHDWQIQTLRTHYPGRLAMMYPSWGMRPGQLDAAVRTDLRGTTPAEKNGEVQRGFDFSRFIAGIKDPGVIVYTTWLDANPPFVDEASPDPARWSPVHYLADCAVRNPLKLQVWGENTGHGNLDAMKLSFQRMRAYKLIGLMWAFESELYDRSGRFASIDDYRRLIEESSEAGR